MKKINNEAMVRRNATDDVVEGGLWRERRRICRRKAILKDIQEKKKLRSYCTN